MKEKKVYQLCVVFCGLLLALSGIACLVVATLVNHDSDLRMSIESKTRTYGTQYWLGMPIIFFGGLMMLISPSLHKKKKMAAYGLCLCIPLLACALVGSILHGTAYTHFNSIYQTRLFLEDQKQSYLCEDVTKESTPCQCSKVVSLGGRQELDTIPLPVPCHQQKSLAGFHGALLTFSAMAFALLLGILVVCVIFLLHLFKLQSPMNPSASGQENEGFSHARGQRHSIDVHIDAPLSQHASQTTLNNPLERPPSYESLMAAFDMTPHGRTSRDAIVTHDVTGERNIAATVNRQARVRYRGQINSSLINQIPGQTEHGGRSLNEVSTSNELQNAEAEMAVNVVAGTTTPNSGPIPQNRQGEPVPLRTIHDRQASREVSTRPDAEDRGMTRMTHQDIEAIRQQTALNDTDEPRSEQSGEPSIEIRSGRSVRNPHSFFEREAIPHEGNNSLGRSSSVRNPSPTEQSSDISMRVIRNSSLRSPQLSSIAGSNNLAYEEDNPTGRNVRNPLSSSTEHASESRPHTPLERTVSSNSEDGVYIDITETSAHNSSPVSSNDSTYIAERYHGQVDSTTLNTIQAQSRVTHEQEDTGDDNVVNANLQERSSEDHDSSNSSNAIISADLVEQTTDSLNSDTAEASGTDIVIDTENPPGNDIHSEIPPRRDGQSISSENNDIYPHNSDTNSVSSLEIMSI